MKNTVESEYSLCPKFEKAFSILGKKWNGLIIDVLIVEEKQRFVDLAKKIPMLSDRVLTERLKELEEENIVEKDGGLYQLTEKGKSLQGTIQAVKDWSHDWVNTNN